MQIVEVRALPHDLHEVREASPSLRQAGLIRRQVTGIQVRQIDVGTEIATASQVGIRVDHRRILAQVRISAGGELCSRACAAAPVAIARPVDQIADARASHSLVESD